MFFPEPFKNLNQLKMNYTKQIFFILLLTATFISACKKENNAEPPVTETATHIQLVSGDSLTADAKTALSEPCRVKILNADGNPVKGIQVSFKITEGDGKVSAATVLSNQDGVAEVIWTLGSESKLTQKLEVSAENKDKNALIGSPIIFTAFVQRYFTDTRDGKKYKIITIGTQTWFAENLNYKTSNSYCYDDKVSNCDTYGRLYIWSAVQTACPSGWHLPTDREWNQLEIALGLPAEKAEEYGGFRDKLNIGGKLKSTTGWTASEHAAATNESGFSALPAGYRNSAGEYYNILNNAMFWSSTPYFYPGQILGRSLTYQFGHISKYGQIVELGASCRCLKD